jgi:hypothetical protein
VTDLPPITCAACGEDHIEDPSTATRVGIAFIGRECTWTLRYPGKAAHEVIEALEARLRGDGSGPRLTPAELNADVTAPPPTDGAAAPDGGSVPPSDDPAERAGGEFAETRPCPVCGGDGEVPDPEEDGSFNPCGRCGGDGTIKVTGG